jgi:GAF domain-containing protein
LSDADDSDLKNLDEISLNLPSLEGLLSPSESSGESLFGSESLLGGGGSNFSQVRLQALETFINTAVRNCSYTELVTDILLAIMNAVQSEAASVLEVDHEKQCLFFRCSVGRASDLLNGFVIPLGKGIAGQVVESRMPVVIDNVEENKTHLRSIGDAVGFETLNMVAMPLVIRGRVYGVLELLNRVGKPNYTAADVETLNYLCEMAAKVIELRMMITWKK